MSSPRPDHRNPALRNALSYAIPEIFWGFGWGLAIDNPMPAAFADGFGGSEGLVGSFGLCAAIGLGIPMIFTGYLLAPWRRKRGLLFWGHLLPSAVLGLLAIALPHTATLGTEAVEWLYLFAFLVFFLSIGILVPAWLSLLGDLFPDHQRTRILGVTFSMNRIGGFVGGTVAERVLASSSMPAVEQWTWLFGMASVSMLAGSLPFLFIVEEPRVPRPRPPLRTYLGGVVGLFRELRTLRRFIAVDVAAVTAMVVIAFYGDVAIRNQGLDDSLAGAWSRVSAVVQLAFALAIAFLGHRVAPRRWLVVGAACIVGASVAAAFATTAHGFGVAAGLGGAWLVIRMTCHAPQVLRLAPGRDGTMPIALAWTATVPMQGIAPFVAGWLMAEDVVGYRPIFLTVGALALVTLVLLSTRVPDHPPPPEPVPGS